MRYATPILVALSVVPVAVGAAPVTLPGGTGMTLTREARSWKTMKFDNVVRQQTDFSYGAAALATILNQSYRRHTTEQQVLVNMLKIADPAVVKEKGFSLLDIKHYVRAIGMTGEGFKVPYDALARLRVPAIALINIKGYKHFVVVRQANAEGIHLADPALGNHVVSRRAFERSWNGIVFVILGQGLDPASALANPATPLTAGDLFGERAPLLRADPTGFGIESATSVRF